MDTKISAPELTLSEIDQLKNQLENPTRRERLKEVQKAIVHILKNTDELKGHFSDIHARDEIKTINSLVEKINKYRREGLIHYDLGCVEDLIGAQMLCPYPDDLRMVLDWLYSRNGGRVFFQLVTNKRTAEKEKCQRENETGYRAYHICLKLKSRTVRLRSLPEGSENEQFELQVKTLLEAGWDTKTHDLTYKAQESTPDLQEHMKLISNALAAIDEQTILLRGRIRQEQTASRELRQAAGRLLFYISLDDEQKKQLGIAGKNIEKWQQADIRQLTKAVEQYYQNNGIDHTLTLGLALLALYQGDLYYQERTLSSASCLVRQADEKGKQECLISALRSRALLRWAFQKTRYAVEDMRIVLQYSNELRDKNSFVYYICELHEPDKSDLQKAQSYLAELENSEKFLFRDTAGTYYIRFGESQEEIRKGLDIVREANEAAKGTPFELVSDAFRTYHEYLCVRQLSKRLSGM